MPGHEVAPLVQRKREPGMSYRLGFYARNLNHATTCDRTKRRCDPHSCEFVAFERMYWHFRENYDLDDFSDDANLVQLVKLHVMADRNEPPPENVNGTKNVQDYRHARLKLIQILTDQLGLSRKLRKQDEAKKDLAKTLEELGVFKKGDGRYRDRTTRVKSSIDDAP